MDRFFIFLRVSGNLLAKQFVREFDLAVGFGVGAIDQALHRFMSAIKGVPRCRMSALCAQINVVLYQNPKISKDINKSTLESIRTV